MNPTVFNIYISHDLHLSFYILGLVYHTGDPVTVGLAHDYDQPEEVNVSEPQGVRGHAGAHFKGFEE